MGSIGLSLRLLGKGSLPSTIQIVLAFTKWGSAVPIDTRFFLFINPLPSITVDPVTGRHDSDIYYLTDVSRERQNCKQVDLHRVLLHEYGFDRQTVDEVRDRLNGGHVMILDVVDKLYELVPQEVILARAVVRNNKQAPANDMDALFGGGYEKAPAIISRRFS